LSYRNSLWNYGTPAAEVMAELFALVDIGIGGREDCQRALGIGKLDIGSDMDDFASLSGEVMSRFPNLELLALTVRSSLSADRNSLTACLRAGDEFLVAPTYAIDDIVDRVGTGDAFAAGLIRGLSRGDALGTTLAFATAAACLKHGIPGDFNRVSVDEVERLLTGDGSGRVRR
jgi:2-dehydro-3-deoxygluconokinase